MELFGSTPQSLTLSLADAQGAPVPLAGVTEVRFKARGPAVIGPLTCTVVDAAAGVVSLELSAAHLAVAGQYTVEVEARWGSQRVTALDTLLVRPDALPTCSVVQGDTPTIQIQVPGVSLSGKTLGFRVSSTPAAGDSPFTGTVSGAGEIATVTLGAADTGTPGVLFGRLTVGSTSTGWIRIDVRAQDLV